MKSTTSQNLINVPTERQLGKGIMFQRTRRITGYLVQDLSFWNKAKLAELNDRTTHMKGGQQ
jgi:hypothetical protein